MAHPYRIREIALQAGVSEATVDRVLHGRPGVRASTVAEVHQAVADLEAQRARTRLTGRSLVVDVVVQAPTRFSSAVRAALEAELPTLRPAALRARFHLREEGPPDELAAVLDRVARRGSQGVLLKAEDHPAVVAAVGRLADQGIPVVTLVSDLPRSRQLAYVGIDNRAAGATAAYLLAQLLTGTAGAVLVPLSRSGYRGEEQRERGFAEALAAMAPGRRIVELDETDGLDASLRVAVAQALAEHPDVDAVYSIGGGNTAILEAFRVAGREIRAFVAHDLDGDNTALLRQRRVTVVLHHDLRQDLRQCCRLLLQAHGVLPGRPHSITSPVQVITPYNAPFPTP